MAPRKMEYFRALLGVQPQSFVFKIDATSHVTSWFTFITVALFKAERGSLELDINLSLH